MDQQGQNGLMSTFREGWRTRNLTAAALGIVLFAFYIVLYFTEAITPIAVSYTHLTLPTTPYV